MAYDNEFKQALAESLKGMSTVHSVGEEWVSYTGNIPSGGIPYCGQEVTRETYKALWEWASARNLIKSESEWQSIHASQNGNVPYYSSGNGSTTFRMPKIVGYVRGASSQSESGSYVAEGLPNIEGRFAPVIHDFHANTAGGAFAGSSYESYIGMRQGNLVGDVATQTVYGFDFNASFYNSIYGNSDHVTPETSVVLFGVFAFGEITNAGALDAETLANGLARVEANLPKAVTSVVGSVIAYASNSAPDGFLLCNGAAVSRTTYSDLFQKIGTTYGGGDGSTTFNLPNLTDRFIQGSGTAGTIKSAGLPNITGYIKAASYTDNISGGAFTADITNYGGVGTGGYLTQTFNFNASRSSSIYGASSTVQPPALTMRYYIKY